MPRKNRPTLTEQALMDMRDELAREHLDLEVRLAEREDYLTADQVAEIQARQRDICARYAAL